MNELFTFYHMSNKKFFVSFFLALFSISAFAQSNLPLYPTQHRPINGDWLILSTDHFKIIYPERLDSIAIKSGKILEQQYPLAKALAGGYLKNFPVVISDYSDLSNGYVQAWNFKSEIILAPIKGKAMNPRSGSWLELVLSHELLHATHANVKGSKGLNAFGFLFGPDLTRSLNFYPPVGIHEGLAVYHEGVNGVSSEHGGRGNYAYFKSKFWSNLMSERPWSLGDGLIPSHYSYPQGRHYIAGYHFIDWLHQSYGDTISKETIERHYNRFIFGYGFALKHTTEQWPARLYNEYIAWAKEYYLATISGTTIYTPSTNEYISGSEEDRLEHRPLWINQENIIYYASSYHSPSGFYIYNIESKKHQLLHETFLVEDYVYSLDKRTNTLYFSSYKAGSRYSDQVNSHLYTLDLAPFLNGEKTQQNDILTIPNSLRMYAPAFDEYRNSVWALKTDREAAQIYELRDETWVQCSDFNDLRPISLQVHEKIEGLYAIIAQKRGIQGVWFFEMNNSSSCSFIQQKLEGVPDVSFKNSSILDINWHPTQEKLLLTKDNKERISLVEYDLSNHTAYSKITTSFGAFEGTYSPTADRLAFIDVIDGKNLVTIISNKNDLNSAKVSLAASDDIQSEVSNSYLGSESINSDTWFIQEYKKDHSWLKPRILFPQVNEQNTFNNEPLTDVQVGLYVQSTDVLQQRSYAFAPSFYQNNFWYDLRYEHKTFWPGLLLNNYRTPGYFSTTLQSNEQIGLISDERGWSIGVPLFYRFNNITRSNFIQFTPTISIDKQRYLDANGEVLSSYINQMKLGFNLNLNFNVQQLYRDIQPRNGLVTQIFSSTSLSDATGRFTLDNNQFTYTLNKRYGIYAEQKLYLPIWKKQNISTLIEAAVLQQSDNLLYSTNVIRKDGYLSPVFPQSAFLGRFTTETIIPVAYFDQGFFIVPTTLQTIYLKLFTHRMYDFDVSSTSNYPTRTSIGSTLNILFNLSNIELSIGFGWIYDVTEKKSDLIMGSF